MRSTSIVIAIMTASSMFQQARAWVSASSSASILGKKSTALEVLKELNQSKKLAAYVTPDSTAVVTGGNSGIGVETVCTLAAYDPLFQHRKRSTNHRVYGVEE